MKTYITFGFDHVHKLGSQRFDRNCVAIIESESSEAGREKAFELFGAQFCMEYSEKFWDDEKMKYFPRGYIEV